MDYIVFIKKEDNIGDFVVKLKKIAHNLNMKIVDNDFYGDYPIHHLKLNFISENEFNIRKNHDLELTKNGVTTTPNGETSDIYYNGSEIYSKNGDYIFRNFFNCLEEYAFLTIFYENKYKNDILNFLEDESEKKLEEIPNNTIKYTRFRDIPAFTRDGSWQADFDFKNCVKYIDECIENEGLELNPDFQRGHVWTEEQQIAWLEFFLRGGRTSRVIYFNKPSWNGSVEKGAYDDFVCVDGLQRLTAIRRFVNNEIKVFGSYFEEYTDSPRFTMSIKLNINDLKTKKEVLQWYIDMNTGGTPHSENEINRVKDLFKQEI